MLMTFSETFNHSKSQNNCYKYNIFLQQQEAHSRQEEVQRQEVNRQHQEAVQRQQQEEYRQVT